MRGRKRSGWGTQECQGSENTLCDSVMMDTGHGTRFHGTYDTERDYGLRVIVTGRCSCIGCNKRALWLMMPIMEEPVCGWPAVGYGRGTASVGKRVGEEGRRQSRNEGDNVQMMKKKIVAETVIKSQQMKCTRKMVIER